MERVPKTTWVLGGLLALLVLTLLALALWRDPDPGEVQTTVLVRLVADVRGLRALIPGAAEPGVRVPPTSFLVLGIALVALVLLQRILATWRHQQRSRSNLS